MKESWRAHTLLRLVIWIPLISITIICSGWYVLQRYSDLERTQEERALTLARQFIPVSQYGLYSKNKRLLQSLANAAISNPDIKTLAFFDGSQQIVAFRGAQQLLNSTVISNKFDNQIHITKRDSKTLNLLVPVTMPDINLLEDQYLSASVDKIAEPTKKQKLVGWLALDYDTRSIMLQEYNSMLSVLGVLFVGILFGAIAAKVIARRLTRNLEQLCRTAREIISGTPPSKADATGTEETAIIQQCLLQMNYELQKLQLNMHQQVDEATLDLQNNVDALEMKNIKLEQAFKDALQANQVKSEFVANMSHEIRTPLNGIIGFTNILLETQQTPLQRDYLRTISRSSKNLLTIINDILDFSKIEAGKIQFDYIPMDLRECVEEVFTNLAATAHEKNIELIPFIQSDVPIKVLGDPLRVKQIISNVLANSVKYTDSGSVSLKLTLNSDQHNSVEIRMEVADTSVGLPADVHYQLLQAFTQGSIAMRREYGETGLGLVIAQRLIQKMAGKINVKSHPGKGSTFAFTLQFDKITSIAGQYIEYKALSGLKIIAYEPNPLTQESIKELFDLWQANSIIIDTQQALESSLQQHPDTEVLLISSKHDTKDISETSTLLAAASKCYNGPILVCINTTEAHLENQFVTQGATTCITKPLSYKNLYRSISNLLSPAQDHISSTTAVDFSSSYDPLSVLVVDDNEPSLYLIKHLLEQLTADVTIGRDGEEAVDLAAKQRFDIIFLDIRLPKLSGIEASSKIRESCELNTTTPIIAVSAHLGPEEKKLMRASGINEALPKPLDKPKLLKLLMKWTDQQLEANDKMATENSAIDWDLSIELAAGKPEVAKEILTAFIKELPDTKAAISKAKEEGNREELHEEVHRLHGACCYCGIPRLKELCNLLETAMDEQEFEKADAYYKDLMQEIPAVLEDYKMHFSDDSTTGTNAASSNSAA